MAELEFGVRQSSSARLHQLEALLTWLAASRSRCRALEVGSYEGESAVYISHRIAALFPEGGSVLCVDPWKPYHGAQQIDAGDNYRRMDEDLKSGEALRRFALNVERADVRAQVSWMRASFEDAMPHLLLHRPFDFVYLDGDHSYEAVKRDIAFARDLVAANGGILCGDDFERSIGDTLGEAQARADASKGEYHAGYHPGVSLAIWEAFRNEVWCGHAVWAVRRRGATWSAEVI